VKNSNSACVLNSRIISEVFRAEIKQEAAGAAKAPGRAFEAYAARFDSNGQPLDEAFTSTVTEHLRLARDEGPSSPRPRWPRPRQLERESGAAADYSAMRDAVAEISSQTSQSAILRSLVTHAEAFAPRGAFFIIKNEHFVGWKTFGAEGDMPSRLFATSLFPVSAARSSAEPSARCRPSTAAIGAHQNDEGFLDPLQYGRPDRMYAVPLTARGRGVAILYADHGTSGAKVNVEALETLVPRRRGDRRVARRVAHAQAEGRDGRQGGLRNTHTTKARKRAAPSYAETLVSEYEAQTPDFTFSEGPSESPFEATPEFSEEPRLREAGLTTWLEFDAGEQAESNTKSFGQSLKPKDRKARLYSIPAARSSRLGRNPRLHHSKRPSRRARGCRCHWRRR
jgi:hypothetical protein